MDFITNPPQPVVVNSSVIGIRYKDGIMLVNDTQAIKHGMKKHRNINWFQQIDDYTLISGSGELADFQEVVRKMKEIQKESWLYQDGKIIQPQEYAKRISSYFYYWRNQLQPKWCSIVVAGINSQTSGFYLAQIDQYGLVLENETNVLTGLARYLVPPIIKNNWTAELDENQAVGLLELCWRELVYRDLTAGNKIQMAKVSNAGIQISDPYTLKSDWNQASYAALQSDKW